MTGTIFNVEPIAAIVHSLDAVLAGYGDMMFVSRLFYETLSISSLCFFIDSLGTAVSHSLSLSVVLTNGHCGISLTYNGESPP